LQEKSKVVNKSLIPLANGAEVTAKATVALTVAALCVGSAHAATVAGRSAAATNMSLERSQRVAATESTALGAISFTVSSTYDQNDEITFTIGGTSGTVALATDAAAVGVTCAGYTASAFTEVTTAGNKTSTLRTYRFTPPSSVSTVDNGISCTVSGFNVLDTSVGTTLNNTVTLRVQGKDGSTNAAIDTGGSATTISALVDEWQVAVTTALDGVIDNKTGGRQFVGGASDALFITVTNQALLNTMESAASTNALVVTFNGDFSYLVNGTGESLGATGQNSIAALAGANSAAAVGAYANVASSDFLQLIGTNSSVTGLRLQIQNAELGSASTTFGVTFGNANASTGNPLSAQNFAATSSYRLAFADGSSETGSTLDAGAWTSNGVNVFVPYMPIGSGIVPTLFWVNNSTATGTVTLRVRGENGTCAASQTQAVTAGMTSLATAFTSLITACQTAGSVLTTDKVFVTLSGTTPIGTSEVYSAFTVGGSSRVTVVNSSSGYRATGSGAAPSTNIGQDNADNR